MLWAWAEGTIPMPATAKRRAAVLSRRVRDMVNQVTDQTLCSIEVKTMSAFPPNVTESSSLDGMEPVIASSLDQSVSARCSSTKRKAQSPA